MKRYVKSSKELFTQDKFLPLEHQLDLASQEAWSLFRTSRDDHETFVSDQAKNIATELDAMIKKVRNLRSFVTPLP